MTDNIANLKQGSEAAFRELVEQWQGMVYNTALGILQNTADAEDVSQEVFMQAYESIGSFKGESKISTWLYRITVTKCLDFLRKKTRKKRWGKVMSIFGDNQELLVDPPDFQHPGVELANKERSQLLFKAIGRLPDSQKAAFVLHKLEGLSSKEIAGVMDASVSAVEGLLHRARQNLRQQLEKYYREGE
ncbi:RNA polymerase sigma factor [Chitinophaga rhizosphaerae]|uniref:RNA polymerase sigma factor n=1 Tax=Chitinophaga rhizosphaerae TaxID=1864947 RepID=UPI000F7FF2C0|nr:RNA polymerase sigma factor [Chitinophaga rhizosphaerae]